MAVSMCQVYLVGEILPHILPVLYISEAITWYRCSHYRPPKHGTVIHKWSCERNPKDGLVHLESVNYLFNSHQ